MAAIQENTDEFKRLAGGFGDSRGHWPSDARVAPPSSPKSPGLVQGEGSAGLFLVKIAWLNPIVDVAW